MSIRTIKDYTYYLFYKFFTFLFLSIPKPITKKILIFFANFAYKYGKKRRRVAKANLDLIYEDKISEEEKKDIIKGSYKTLLFNMYEFIENQHISKEELLAKAKITNEEVILNALKEKRKIIWITAHYGGWEIGVPYMALKYGKIVAVVKDMENPFIQKDYKFSRQRNNIEMFDKNSSAKELVKGLKKGLPSAIMIDQHIGIGTDLEFLGKKDTIIDSSSRLALKFDAVIILAFATMNDFRDYTIEVHDPIDVKKVEFTDEDKITQLTRLQVQAVEKQIRKNPSQWLWQHKRWKKYYGHIYKK